MPRKPRFYLPGIPAHIVQRGNNRAPVFFTDDDYAAYRHWLSEGSRQFGCAVHAYVLMTNHVHLLVTPNESNAISQLIQFVGRHYVTYVNRTYQRTGTLWEGRHKGSLIDSDRYLFTCSRYIEINPVRAGMVERPDQYPWSSFAHNAWAQPDPLITTHPLYEQLGGSHEDRAVCYREFFSSVMPTEDIKDIRASVQTGTPLCDHRLRTHIETTVGRSVGHARRGRPEKPSE